MAWVLQLHYLRDLFGDESGVMRGLVMFLHFIEQNTILMAKRLRHLMGYARFPLSLKNLSILFLLIGLASCGGAMGPGGGLDASPTNTGEGDVKALPPVSIPAPTLQKMIVAAADSENYIPVIGFQESVPESYADGDHYMMVAKDAEDIARLNAPHNAAFASLNKPSGFMAHLQKATAEFNSLFMPRALALSAPISPNVGENSAPLELGQVNISPPNLASNDENFSCDGAGDNRVNVACCPIHADGSFQCYMPTNPKSLASEVCIGVVSKTKGLVEDSVNCKKVNKNLLWLADAPANLTVANDELSGVILNQNSYALAGGYGKKIVTNAADAAHPRFMVEGFFEDKYRNFLATDGNQLSYNPDSNGVMGILRPAAGIDLRRLNADGEFPDRDILRTEPGIIEYKQLKMNWDGKMRFIGKRASNQGFANLLEIYGAFDRTVINPNNPDRISILTRADIDYARVSFKEPIAYDVDSYGCGLALFKDAQDLFRLRLGCNDTMLYSPSGGTSSIVGLNANSNPSDLVIINENNNADVITGTALLIDQGTNKIWKIDYKMVPILARNINNQPSITTQLIEANSLSLGSHIKSMGISPDRAYLYALNDEEDKLVAIKLRNSNGTVLTFDKIKLSKTEVNLKDHLGDFDGKFKPSSLTVQENGDNRFLLVGMEGLQSSLVIDSKDIETEVDKKVPESNVTPYLPTSPTIPTLPSPIGLNSGGGLKPL